MVPPNQAKSPSPSVFSIATSDSSSGLWMAWQAKPQWERQSGREVEVKQISKTTWQVGGSLKKRRLLQLKPSWSVQMCENFRFFRLPKLILTIPCSKCWLSYTDTIRYLSISFPQLILTIPALGNYSKLTSHLRQAAITHLPKEVVAKERKARAIRKSDHLVVLTLFTRLMSSRLLQFLIHTCVHR